MNDDDDSSTQPEPEPIRMSSTLPGDATMDSSPSPSPEPQPSHSLLPSSSSQPPPTASTSSIPYTEPKTHTLTSISPSDPSKSRSFECRYLVAPNDSTSLAAQSSRSFLDLPESYFAPTPVELQQAFAGQVKKREELVDRPLLTQKLRDREEAQKSREKAKKWPNTRIRIRFSDRSQLEGVFPSTDKLIHLYEFVKLSLAPQHSQTPFILYQSPPRTEYIKGDLKWKGKNLMELEFTPSSALYIKFTENDLLNDPSNPPPLRSELLEIASLLPPPPSFDPNEATKKEGDKSGELKRKVGNGLGGDRGKVVPSWMRLGGKNAKK